MGKNKLQETITTTAKIQKQLTKKETMLLNEDVLRWHDNMNASTASSYLRNVDNFCRVHFTTPAGLVEMARKPDGIKNISDLVQDHIKYQQKKGDSGGFIKNIIKAVKSWLAHNDIILYRKFYVKNANKRKKNIPPPTENQLSNVTNIAKLRTRCWIQGISKAGFRPMTFGDRDGSDGLKFKDLLDYAEIKGEPVFLCYPPSVQVRPELSKTGKEYMTMISNGCAKVWMSWIKELKANGYPCGPEDAVFPPDPTHKYGRGRNEGKKHLCTGTIRQLIDEVTKKEKFNPYKLRNYFAQKLEIADKKDNPVPFNHRQFLMGHEGMTMQIYLMHGMSDELKGKLRQSYRNAEKYLDSDIHQEDPSAVKKEEAKAEVETMTTGELEKFLEWRTLGHHGKNQQLKKLS